MSRSAVIAAVIALLLISVFPISRALVSSVLVDDAPGATWEVTSEHFVEAFVPEQPPGTFESVAPGAAPVRAPGTRLRLLGNSVLIGLGAALLALLFGVPYALLSARTDVPGRRFLAGAYLVPLVLPPLLVAVAWNYVPFLEPPPITEATGPSPWGGVIAVLRASLLFALCYFPIVVLFARRALTRVPASLEESARLVGGPLLALRRVTLPLAAPGILAGALFVFLFALNDFAVVDFLNWVRPTQDRIAVYPFESFVAWSKSQGPGVATALGTPLALIGVALLFAVHRLVGARTHAGMHGAVSGTYRAPKDYELGHWRIPALCAAIGLLTLSAGAPLLALLWKSSGLEAYRAVWKVIEGPTSSTHEIRWTLWFAGLAAFLAVPLAFVLGHHAARTGRARYLGLAVLPLALPPIFLGAGYLRLVNAPWIVEAFGNNPFLDPDSPQYGPALLLVAKYLPFAIVALWAAFLEIDPRLEEAAVTAGVRPLARTLGILEPLVRPASLLAGVLVFVLALREIDTIVLLSGNTILRKIYTMIHFQRDEQVAALCILLVLIQALALLVLWILRGGTIRGGIVRGGATRDRAPLAASSAGVPPHAS